MIRLWDMSLSVTPILDRVGVFIYSFVIIEKRKMIGLLSSMLRILSTSHNSVMVVVPSNLTGLKCLSLKKNSSPPRHPACPAMG